MLCEHAILHHNVGTGVHEARMKDKTENRDFVYGVYIVRICHAQYQPMSRCIRGTKDKTPAIDSLLILILCMTSYPSCAHNNTPSYIKKIKVCIKTNARTSCKNYFLFVSL